MVKIKTTSISAHIIVTALLVTLFSTAHLYAYSTFNAANIISDNQILNAQSPYPQQQIQDFLTARVPNCAVGTCLKNYTDPANGQSSAQIIATAATTYNISPKVLLALLETETLLVTNNSPTQSNFDNAFGVPGSAGFTAQTNQAAKKLADVMTGLQSPLYPVGAPTAVPYKLSNGSCPSPQITIANLATASLYSYPGLGEQPNPAAIAANYGAGDSCSSYGIRNFFIHYDQWFNPSATDITPPTAPYNLTASAQQTNGSISFQPSTDNVNVTGYSLYRNGILLVNLPSTSTSYTDTGLSYGSTYSYYVVAHDAAGNTSQNSNTINLPIGDTRVTVFRLYSPLVKRHLYSADAYEVSYLSNNMAGIWNSEGASFKVKSVANCQTGQSVYRFYSQAIQTHLYTIDENEKNYISSNFPPSIWSYEGVSYCADTVQAPGTLPLYRFYSQTLKTHLYTLDENEKSYIMNNFPKEIWGYEGIAYYVFPAI